MNIQNIRPKPDGLFTIIAEYVLNESIQSELAFKTAYQSFLDSLGCAMLALKVKGCTDLMGPIVPGTKVPKGSRVPGTNFELDPIQAAFDIGTCIRWLDYNDTWLAQEWGHPSDNLGGILAVLDFLSRNPNFSQSNKKTFTVFDILEGMIKAHEIQGVIALENAFNRVGLDHVILVKLATTAVVSKYLGLNKDQIIDALSHVFIDGHPLRTYRHAPNTGPRKSWAAGDATSRGVRLAWLVMQGQKGYPSALSAKQWGFNDVLFKGQSIKLERPFGSYVMEQVLFKVLYPAEFHAQTAVEAAIKLHPIVEYRLNEIDKIEINTQEAGMRIINKEGPLYDYADRDHCIQYMVAIGLLFGELKAEHYDDETAKDERIDKLRSLMNVQEDKQYSKDYLDPEKRAIPNSVQLFFKDGSHSNKIEVLYPIGHKTRREEAEPYLKNKYSKAISGFFQGKQAESLLNLWDSKDKTQLLSVDKFMDLWIL